MTNPIFNPQVEAAVIGWALVDPANVKFIKNLGVDSSWFYDPANFMLWRAIESSPHGPVEVKQYLRDAGQNDLADRVHTYIDAAPVTSGEIPWFVDQLRTQFHRRKLDKIGKRIIEAAAVADTAIQTTIDDTRREFDQIVGSTCADDGRSLVDFARMEIDHEETLLGNRYLCRGGSMLFVGPSGIGKSSASCQQDMLWSIGREAFGIRPARPLRILAFQAENDDGDQHEMAAGVVRGLRLTGDELSMVHANTRYLTRFEAGLSFLSMMASEVEKWKPDLVRLDPLNAYIGDDAKEPKVIAAFCRSGINPILHRNRCGCVVAHHTPKTNFRDTSNWTPLDWAYAGSGGADLTNWARAVLVVDPVNLAEGIFKFIGAKRGGRMNWRNNADEIEITRYFCYAREPGVICWREPEAGEITEAQRSATKSTRTPDDVLEYVPPSGELIGKETLLEHACRILEIGQNKGDKLLKVLIERKAVHIHKVKRSGKRDSVFIGRHEQVEPAKPLVMDGHE